MNNLLSSALMCPARVLFILLAAISPFLSLAKGGCQFPEDWTGEWFQSGKGYLHVNQTHFYGTCVKEGKSNRYLVYIAHEKCHKCMVINKKHKNVIQYKESYCNPTTKDLVSLCMDITGDAILYSMFRLDADPVSCPFRGPLTFTYSKGYGECKDPVSQIDSCADDSRLLFRQQACPDIPKSESQEEELVCLGFWKEGSNYYMVGKINHSHANTDEDRYRCFIYEWPRYHKHRRQDANTDPPEGHTWHLSMSADATCQGLVSPDEGGKTMVLTKVSRGSKNCKFPSWLSSSSYWHTLNESESYFLYHHNSSLKISNGTSPTENPEVRGHTDIRLVCHKYEGYHDSRDRHKEHHSTHHKSHHDHSDNVTIIVHFTVGCRSGYKCMRIYRRDDHVVQVLFGQDALNAEEACKSYYWIPSKDNLITLVSREDTVGTCGPHGRYHIPDTQAACSSATDSKSQSYTHLTVGCLQANSLQLRARCPQDTIHSFQCHGEWTSDDVTYVVASPLSRPSGAPRRVCFAYSSRPAGAGDNPGASSLIFTARHDTCISREHDARISLNASLIGQCTELPGISSSGSTLRERAWTTLILGFLCFRWMIGRGAILAWRILPEVGS